MNIYIHCLSEIHIYPVFLFAKYGNPKSEYYLQILTGKKELMQLKLCGKISQII